MLVDAHTHTLNYVKQIQLKSVSVLYPEGLASDPVGRVCEAAAPDPNVTFSEFPIKCVFLDSAFILIRPYHAGSPRGTDGQTQSPLNLLISLLVLPY